MDLQLSFLDQLVAKLPSTPLIRAVWLEGSFGRGNADRFSDLDLHAVVDDVELVKGNAYGWLSEIRPLVLFKLLFDGKMINAMTVDGLRLDVWLHADAPALLDAAKVKVLYDPAALLTFGAMEIAPLVVDASQLRAQIEEFWRCVGMLPVVIGRNERIVSLQGLFIELNLVIDLVLRGYEIQREAGVKSLDRFLPEAIRTEIENALSMNGLSRESLIRSHLALAAIVKTQGRMIAERHGFHYPVYLEQAVVEYIQKELSVDIV